MVFAGLLANAAQLQPLRAEVALSRNAVPHAPFPADALHATLSAPNATFAAVVYDAESLTPVYAQNANVQLPAASLVKLPIVMTIYHLAGRGELSLDELITLRRTDKVGGSGSIQRAPNGTRYTVRELCARMLHESDNTAANMILKRIGFAPVNALLEQLGAHQTRVQRLMLDTVAAQAGRDNVTSAQDMALILRALDERRFTDEHGTNAIIAALTQNTDRTKLPALLPSGVQVAHKTGALVGIEHDAGLVTLPNGRRYIIVVMSQGLRHQATGVWAIARASKQVHDWFAE